MDERLRKTGLGAVIKINLLQSKQNQQQLGLLHACMHVLKGCHKAAQHQCECGHRVRDAVSALQCFGVMQPQASLMSTSH